MGCVSRDDALLAVSPWLTVVPPDPRFGDADMVVALVVAVGGRSSGLLEFPAPAGGFFPVRSSL